MNIKKYEKDIREANRKRGFPGTYHGFQCVAVQYQKRDNEWNVVFDTPFGEGHEPIGGEGIMQFICQRFELLQAAFWEQSLKSMSQVATKKGAFWRVTLKVRISPNADLVGIPVESEKLYLTVQAIQRLLNEKIDEI
ncbi:MAG: hypothetical protein QM657_15605 [Lacrimispora sp.]|uniref:hypothetical protein n=1 Tax=Lacrimispora sp. TaxID=2719234 RepID=UPI0039E61A07